MAAAAVAGAGGEAGPLGAAVVAGEEGQA